MNDFVVVKQKFLQSPKSMEVVLLYLLEFVRRQVQDPEARGVLEHTFPQTRELIAGKAQIFKPGHLFKAASTEIG